MKLQRSISRHAGGKAYTKNQIVIKNDTIVKLGWNQGDQLETRITPKGLLLYKVDPKQRAKKLCYNEFREAVISTLRSIPHGCAWSELKLRAGLQQLTPSPIWVRRLEDERNLKRVRDPVTSKVLWKPVDITTDRSRLNGWISKTENQNG
jgi:hypothetical protein